MAIYKFSFVSDHSILFNKRVVASRSFEVYYVELMDMNGVVKWAKKGKKNLLSNT